ncbi:hypothetical protein [Singulisphaera sp. PoT]|uniref:hypothetical protein n=1 Tax=Singulisphaera sp. PoT TaxID=3411797 RepID=UPI003BF4B7FE
MLRNRMASFLLVPAIVAWGGAVAIGLGMVHAYDLSPGVIGPAPARWPAESGLRHDTSRMNLIMFAHPRCPCTRASLAALSELMDHCRSSVSAEVLFYEPSEVHWGEAELWRKARAIPGVKVRGDRDGAEAERFGAMTSGTVLLFDPTGKQLFMGGITGGRGQSGPNAGLASAIALASEDPSQKCPKAHPVFGCPIQDVPIANATEEEEKKGGGRGL